MKSSGFLHLVILAGVICFALLACDSTSSDYHGYLAPEIVEFSASSDFIQTGDTLHLSVLVEDPDPDQVIFAWSHDGTGEFIGATNTPEVSWIARDEQIAETKFVTFTIDVSDAEMSLSDSLEVLVSHGFPALLGHVELDFEEWNTSLSVDGRIACVGVPNRSVEILDLSNVMEPRNIASFPYAFPRGGDLRLNLPYMYLPGWFTVADMSSYRSPVLLESDSLRANQMVLDGSILYTANFGVLTVYDVSDPESPLLL
jgi:hypothetical protein